MKPSSGPRAVRGLHHKWRGPLRSVTFYMARYGPLRRPAAAHYTARNWGTGWAPLGTVGAGGAAESW